MKNKLTVWERKQRRRFLFSGIGSMYLTALLIQIIEVYLLGEEPHWEWFKIAINWVVFTWSGLWVGWLLWRQWRAKPTVLGGTTNRK